MIDIWVYWTQHRDQVAHWTWTTAWLAVLPVVAGLMLGGPLGLVASRSRHAYAALVGTANIVYTIPSLVIFLVLPAVLGTRILDPANVAVALAIYTTCLVLRSVADAMKSVPADVVAAAEAIGHTPRQVVLRVQLPLAAPVIAGTVRVATVANVSLVSVGSVIGTAQLGDLFVAGNNIGSLAPIWLGLALFLSLAALLDGTLQLVTRVVTPWQRAA